MKHGGQRTPNKATAKEQPANNAGQIFAQAVAHHNAGSHAQAQALCERLLQHHPNHFDALHLLGVSKSGTNQLAQAEAILQRALSIQPRAAAAHYHLGLVHFALKQFNAACASYELALAVQPNFPLALNNGAAGVVESNRLQAGAEIAGTPCKRSQPHAAYRSRLRIVRFQAPFGGAVFRRGVAQS